MKLCVLFALLVMGTVLLPTVTLAEDPRDAAASVLLGGDLAGLEWDSDRLVTEHGTAVARLELGHGYIVKSFSLLRDLPPCGKVLDDKAFEAKGRALLKQLVPASWDVDGLDCQLGDRPIRGTRLLYFRGARDDVVLPPRILMHLTPDGRVVRHLGIPEQPLPDSALLPPQIDIEQAKKLALATAVQKLSKQTGKSKWQVMWRARYAPSAEAPKLRYSNQPEGYNLKFPTPCPIWYVRIERTKPAANGRDGLPDYQGVMVDGNTGATMTPPDVVGGSLTTGKMAAGAPSAAYALAALAALLLIFLVVKLRKR